jgi:hypothetical protein
MPGHTICDGVALDIDQHVAAERQVVRVTRARLLKPEPLTLGREAQPVFRRSGIHFPLTSDLMLGAIRVGPPAFTSTIYFLLSYHFGLFDSISNLPAAFTKRSAKAHSRPRKHGVQND